MQREFRIGEKSVWEELITVLYRLGVRERVCEYGGGYMLVGRERRQARRGV